MYRKIQKNLPEGLADPQIVCAQAMFETATDQEGEYVPFTSFIFAMNNNPFGMRLAKIRSTTAAGEKNGYAYYHTIADSIKDLARWLDWNNIPYTDSDTMYAQALKLHLYYEAEYENYKEGMIRQHINLEKVLIKYRIT